MYRSSRSFWVFIVLAAAVFGIAGCETFSPAITPQAREGVVSAGVEETFWAAKAALEEMDFRVAHAAPRRGRLEGVTSIVHDPAFQEAWQGRAVVEVVDDGADGARVRVWFSRVVQAEDEGFGTRTHEVHLRDQALFDRFFEGVERRL